MITWHVETLSLKQWPSKKMQVDFKHYYKDWYALMNHLNDITLALPFVGAQTESVPGIHIFIQVSRFYNNSNECKYDFDIFHYWLLGDFSDFTILLMNMIAKKYSHKYLVIWVWHLLFDL